VQDLLTRGNFFDLEIWERLDTNAVQDLHDKLKEKEMPHVFPIRKVKKDVFEQIDQAVTSSKSAKEAKSALEKLQFDATLETMEHCIPKFLDAFVWNAVDEADGKVEASEILGKDGTQVQGVLELLVHEDCKELFIDVAIRHRFQKRSDLRGIVQLLKALHEKGFVEWDDVASWRDSIQNHDAKRQALLVLVDWIAELEQVSAKEAEEEEEDEQGAKKAKGDNEAEEEEEDIEYEGELIE
jgi:hypothetical protein